MQYLYRNNLCRRINCRQIFCRRNNLSAICLGCRRNVRRWKVCRRNLCQQNIRSAKRLSAKYPSTEGKRHTSHLVPVNVLWNLYYTLIKSCFTYTITAWNHHHILLHTEKETVYIKRLLQIQKEDIFKYAPKFFYYIT